METVDKLLDLINNKLDNTQIKYFLKDEERLKGAGFISAFELVTSSRYQAALEYIKRNILNLSKPVLNTINIIEKIIENTDISYFLDIRKINKMSHKDICDFKNSIINILTVALDLNNYHINSFSPYLIFCFIENFQKDTISVCNRIIHKYDPKRSKNKTQNINGFLNKFIYKRTRLSDRISFDKDKNCFKKLEESTIKSDIRRLELFVKIISLFIESDFNFNIYDNIILFNKETALFQLILNDTVFDILSINSYITNKNVIDLFSNERIYDKLNSKEYEFYNDKINKAGKDRKTQNNDYKNFKKIFELNSDKQFIRTISRLDNYCQELKSLSYIENGNNLENYFFYYEDEAILKIKNMLINDMVFENEIKNIYSEYTVFDSFFKKIINNISFTKDYEIIFKNYKKILKEAKKEMIQYKEKNIKPRKITYKNIRHKKRKRIYYLKKYR